MGSTGSGTIDRRRRRPPLGIGTVVLLFLLSLPVADPMAAAKIDVRQDLRCLALTIYFEARGEPDQGKLAVGHVVMNRASHPLFPQAVCEVVRQGGEKILNRCQFTWWCDGQSDQPTDWIAWQRSKALARAVYWDYSTDPTGGALWYHADYVQPVWRTAFERGPKIGRHIFYRATGKSPNGGGQAPTSVQISYGSK